MSSSTSVRVGVLCVAVPIWVVIVLVATRGSQDDNSQQGLPSPPPPPPPLYSLPIASAPPPAKAPSPAPPPPATPATPSKGKASVSPSSPPASASNSQVSSSGVSGLKLLGRHVSASNDGCPVLAQNRSMSFAPLETCRDACRSSRGCNIVNYHVRPMECIMNSCPSSPLKPTQLTPHENRRVYAVGADVKLVAERKALKDCTTLGLATGDVASCAATCKATARCNHIDVHAAHVNCIRRACEDPYSVVLVNNTNWECYMVMPV